MPQGEGGNGKSTGAGHVAHEMATGHARRSSKHAILPSKSECETNLSETLAILCGGERKLAAFSKNTIHN
jgi:hypothetical protein